MHDILYPVEDSSGVNNFRKKLLNCFCIRVPQIYVSPWIRLIRCWTHAWSETEGICHYLGNWKQNRDDLNDEISICCPCRLPVCIPTKTWDTLNSSALCWCQRQVWLAQVSTWWSGFKWLSKKKTKKNKVPSTNSLSQPETSAYFPIYRTAKDFRINQ